MIKDRSSWSLLAANLFTIFLAISEGWAIGTLLWIYWAQSVTIGFFNFVRIITLKEFTTDGLTSNGQPVPETREGRNGVAGFFLIHYGAFHLAYLLVLWQHGSGVSVDFPGVALASASAVFFLNHLFSFMYNREELMKKPNLGTLMFYPYLRIIPMHLTFIFFGVNQLSLPFFMAMKTVADLGMHEVEHRLRRAK